jgi:hypothetical protein
MLNVGDFDADLYTFMNCAPARTGKPSHNVAWSGLTHLQQLAAGAGWPPQVASTGYRIVQEALSRSEQ